MKSQFARLEAYSNKEVHRILEEASRQPDYCQHVERPTEPTWIVGNPESIRKAVTTFMGTDCLVNTPSGVRLRKRRNDWRCLVAGVASWPNGKQDYRQGVDWEHERQMLWRWIAAVKAWLEQQFKNRLQAIVLHLDEEYPHLHFFIVGDANRVHPGLNAEFEGPERLSSKTEKQRRYAAAMSAWLDDYHKSVAEQFGMVRRKREQNLPRIKDRATALRILRIEKLGRDLQTDKLSEALANAQVNTPRLLRPRHGF